MYVSLIVSLTQLFVTRLELQHRMWAEVSLIYWNWIPSPSSHFQNMKLMVNFDLFPDWPDYLAWCEGPRQTVVVSWCACQVLYGSNDMAISSLAWISEPGSQKFRLISGGLDGFLVDWDLAAGVPLARTDALGGAVWAISRRPLTDTENGTALWYLASMIPCSCNTLLLWYLACVKFVCDDCQMGCGRFYTLSASPAAKCFATLDIIVWDTHHIFIVLPSWRAQNKQVLWSVPGH